jgi:hypothetical protein
VLTPDAGLLFRLCSNSRCVEELSGLPAAGTGAAGCA